MQGIFQQELDLALFPFDSENLEFELKCLHPVSAANPKPQHSDGAVSRPKKWFSVGTG